MKCTFNFNYPRSSKALVENFMAVWDTILLGRSNFT